MTVVRKRDGREVTSSKKLIEKAVYNAAMSCDWRSDEALELADLVAEDVSHKIEKKQEVSVEEIQDLVEKRLMRGNDKVKSVAQEYVSFRSMRDRNREARSDLYKELDGFLDGTDDQHARENSNKAADQIVTHRDLIAGIVSKQYAKSLLPKKVLTGINQGLIWVHDTDYIISSGIHNCGVYDFEYMLANGVKLGDVEIETPSSIETAANISCQIFSKISGSSYGGQTMHEFDKVMRPYAQKTLDTLREEQKTYSLSEKYIQHRLRKSIYKACRTFIFQIQTVTSSNGQSAFTTISLSLSTDPMCKLIKEIYLKCHMKGIGPNGKTPIFPKVLYFVEEGVNLNKEDPNYEEFRLALKCSSKHLYPDLVYAPNNRKMTGDSKNVITSMGCRSFVPKYIENGKEKTTARFNLGVSTISLPYAALLAGGDKEKFFDEVKKGCDLCFEANMFRIKRLKGTKAKVSPILWMYGALATLDAEDTIDHLFYNGNATCSIGYAGLAEAMEIVGDNSKEFGMEVMKFIRKLAEEYTEETDIYFSPYGTPLESGTYKFAKAIKRDFPEYGFDKDYITNSYHRPVSEDLDIESKFEAEADYYLLSSGGNVNNVELPNLSSNLDGLEAVVKMSYDKVNYLIMNQPVDACYECGFRGEFEASVEGYKCPECGNNNPETASCIRRISGYTHDALARPANQGKFQEQRERVKHL